MALGSGAVPAQAPSGDSTPPEILRIDGGKNPELIPQWSAWGFAFRVIAGGSRELPSVVYHVVSKDEAAMLLREADAIQKIDKACLERGLKLHSSLARTDTAVLDARLRELNLECRRRTLDARDRVLEALNPEGAAALIMFVESTKRDTSISVPRNALARFLEPE
ncbi:MAG TPA: hypothetical protein VMM79_02550 [Longimicrobiales bacterium]|nr:hypothetical protein [Longimicrobiales bacterium]